MKIRKRKWHASEIRIKKDLRMRLFVVAAFINQALLFTNAVIGKAAFVNQAL